MKELFSDKHVVKSLLLADIDSSQTSARIELSKLHKLAIVINAASLAADLAFTVKQSNAASGGTTKELYQTTPYYVKAGAATSFTKTEQSTPNDTYNLASLNNAVGVVVVEIDPREMDFENGFKWAHIVFTDPAAARIVSVLGVSDEPRFMPGYSQAI